MTQEKKVAEKRLQEAEEMVKYSEDHSSSVMVLQVCVRVCARTERGREGGREGERERERERVSE